MAKKMKTSKRTTPKKKKYVDLEAIDIADFTEWELYLFEEAADCAVSNMGEARSMRPMAALKAVILARQGVEMSWQEVLKADKYRIVKDGKVQGIDAIIHPEKLAKLSVAVDDSREDDEGLDEDGDEDGELSDNVTPLVSAPNTEPED